MAPICAVLRWFASPNQPPRRTLAHYARLCSRNTKNGRFAPALARARNVVPERRLQSNLVCMHLKCVRKCYVASPTLPGAPLIKWIINDPNKKTSPYWLFHRIFRQFLDFSRKMKVRFRCRYLVYPPKYEVPRLRSTRHSAQLVLNSEIWTIWKPIASMGWSFYLGRPGVVNCPFN